MHRLLIVDDERFTVDGLYEMIEEIEDLELDLYRAYSPEEALDWLARTQIDIVLSDVRMPGMTGLELQKRIVAQWPRCKIIFLTGIHQLETAQHAIRSGSIDYILKTEGDEAIERSIRKAVEALEAESASDGFLLQARLRMSEAMPLLRRDWLQALLELQSPPVTDAKLAELQIPLRSGVPVIPLIGRIDWPADGAGYGERSFMYAVQNIAAEYYASLAFVTISMDMHHFVCLAQPRGAGPEAAELEGGLSVNVGLSVKGGLSAGGGQSLDGAAAADGQPHGDPSASVAGAGRLPASTDSMPASADSMPASTDSMPASTDSIRASADSSAPAAHAGPASEQTDAGDWQQTLRFAQGTMAAVQQTCERLLKLKLSLVCCTQPVAWTALPGAYESMKKQLVVGLGARDRMLLLWHPGEEGEKPADVPPLPPLRVLNANLERLLEEGTETEFEEAVRQYTSLPARYADFAIVYYGIASLLLSQLTQGQSEPGEEDIGAIDALMNLTAHQSREAALQHLLRTASGIYSKRKSMQTERTHQLIAKLHHYIRGHLGGDLSLTRLSEIAYLNPAYLSVLYKQQTGGNLSEYIAEARLEKAKELLATTPLKIHEIAEQVGFESAGYFNRFFKKRLHVTPQEFRARE